MYKEILINRYYYQGYLIEIYEVIDTIGIYYRGIIPSIPYAMEDREESIVIEVLERHIDYYG